MKRDIIREKILTAAETVFERHGYDKTILDDLGREAGMNKTSLYYYYPNKEEIFAAVIHRQSEAYIQALESKIAKKKNGKNGLRTYLENRTSVLKKFLLLHKAKSSSLFTSESIVNALLGTHETEIKFVKQLIATGIKNGELKKSSEKGAKVILAALNSLSLNGKSAEKDTALLVAFLLDGIGKGKKEKVVEIPGD
jgi:AcrR family transcriptional regulator